jgi:hypothetical protein
MQVISLGVKRPGREAYYSPQSSTKLKNVGAIIPGPICLHGVVIKKGKAISVTNLEGP